MKYTTKELIKIMMNAVEMNQCYQDIDWDAVEYDLSELLNKENRQ